ncbi:MAG TPA: CPBP family intramembrane glutamic endopeptidase [Candidatus Acidoferrales bacterium]|nr:CPBP family intramembrane glutamic endopeptidase [Candidatus Acidoferrales bacterium]
MSLRRIFLNDRGLRAGWRLLIWVVIAGGIDYGLEFLSGHSPNHYPFLDPRWLLMDEALPFIAALIATLIMARIEDATLRDYYIPTRDLFGRQFWQGLLWGFLAVSLLIGLIAAFHGYRIIGIAIHGDALLRATLWWLVMGLVIGVSEEVAYRGYLLRTLADGIYFWPAAILLSSGFGAMHYFSKPYERWEDFASTGLLGLFSCFAIRRTGSLKFVIGFHAAFDWAAIFLYSGRNAGEYAVGHLLQTSWVGPDWLTGGMLGPEASWFAFIVIALLFLAFSQLYPSCSRSSPRQAA